MMRLTALRLRWLILCFGLVMGLSACDNPEKNFASYLARGDSYYQEKDYIRARLEYRNAAQIKPTDARTIYSLGLVEEAESNLSRALSAYLTAEQQDPTFMPVLVKLAEFFLTAGMADESLARVQKILAIDPDHAQAHALNGSLYLRRGNYGLARREANKALEKDSGNVVAYSVLAGTDFAQGDYAAAQKVLDDAITVAPKEMSFYLLKATFYSEERDISGLIRTYNMIFDLAPPAIGYRFDLAAVLQEYDRIDEAEALLQETIVKFPDSIQAKHKYVTFVEREKGVDAAEAVLQDFIAADASQKVFSLWLADLYVRNGRNDDAIALLTKTLDQNPDNMIGLNASTALAGIRLQEGDMKLAGHLIGVVLQKDVNNQTALLLRANLAFSEGDYQKAIAELRAILVDNPDNLKASRILSEALLIQGRLDLAVDTLIRAAQRHPDDVGTLVRLAQLYSLRDNLSKSEDILALVTERFPNNPLGWETMARLSIENGQTEKAAQAISILKGMEGYEETASYLRGRLYEKEGSKKEASAIYRSIIVNDPLAPLASYALSSLTEMAKTDDELRDFRDFLLSLNSSDARVLTVLGVVDMALGNDDEAEISLRTAIRANPDSQAPYISLAELMQKKGDVQQALDILEKAERAVQSEIKASMKRTQILLGSGQVTEAAAIYDTILKRDSEVEAVANNLAQIIADYQYNDKDSLERARLVAERFINSDNPYYLDTLGWVYYRSGLMTQAQTVLARAVDLLDKPNAQIEYHYGAVLMALGQGDVAKEHLQKAVVDGADYEGLDDARALLEKVMKE